MPGIQQDGARTVRYLIRGAVCCALPVLLSLHGSVQAQDIPGIQQNAPCCASAEGATSPACVDSIKSKGNDGRCIALANSLNELGNEALKIQDLKKAEEYHLRALEIRRRLVPGSLELAETLTALGQVVERRGALTKAKKYYLQSFAIRQHLAPESLAIADSLNHLGNVAMESGNLLDAEKDLQRALDIRQNLAPGSRYVGISFISLGNFSWHRGDVLHEEMYFHQALSLQDKLAPLDIASIFDGLGNVCIHRANIPAAEEYFQQALEIRQRVAPESLAVAVSLSNLGNMAIAYGDPARAGEYFHHALEIRQKTVPGSLVFASSLSNLGSVAQLRGNLAEAEEDFRRALEIKQALAPKSLGISDSLFQLGILFWIREDLARGEKYLYQAAEIRRRLAPESPSLAQSLNWLGLISSRRGDLAQAEAYFREALDINEKLSPVNLGTAEALGGLGGVARSQGNLSQAEKYFHQVLDIQDQLSPGSPAEAFTLERLGELAQRRQDLAEAEGYFRQALSIRESRVPGSLPHAGVLFSLASVLHRQHQLDAAEQLFSQATGILESEASQLGGTEDERSFFRARYEAQYKEYIDLLIAERKPELAFHVLERSRARSLLEMLANARLNIRSGCDPRLLRQERSLRESISLESNYRVRLLDGIHTEKQLAVLDQQIAGLREQHEEIEEQIRFKSPAYAALTQPRLLSAKDVQQQLLDSNTVLIEYSLGINRSYVWVISETALTVHELPSRKKIEMAAWDLYESLTEQSRRVDKETIRGRQIRLAQANAEYAKASAELSQMVLGPVATLLGKKRLIIVSDGALQYVPFAALPMPSVPSVPSGSVGPEVATAVPLVMEHEIVYLPSASVLAELRQAKKNQKKPPLEVAVLADPVFDKSDERVTAPQAQNRHPVRKAIASREVAQEPSLFPDGTQYSAMNVSTGVSRGGAHLQRLLWTNREAAAILKVTPAGRGMEALGFQANRATVTSSVLARYRIIHFATHAVLNSEHPELSGLVLSLVDQHGHPQNGFLGLEQIYNLNLPADMVVLSACDTGLGQQINGEGLIGLARGFMYAGASRVVASLWSVDDEVTAELMARFYKGMERDKLSPAAALRLAQVQIAKEERWRSPYYWAGFQLAGEWK